MLETKFSSDNPVTANVMIPRDKYKLINLQSLIMH